MSCSSVSSDVSKEESKRHHRTSSRVKRSTASFKPQTCPVETGLTQQEMHEQLTTLLIRVRIDTRNIN
jgi:hypothetical protein